MCSKSTADLLSYVYIPTTTSVAMNTTVKNKKDKVDRMFTQFFKISQLHSYKIH